MSEPIVIKVKKEKEEKIKREVRKCRKRGTQVEESAVTQSTVEKENDGVSSEENDENALEIVTESNAVGTDATNDEETPAVEDGKEDEEGAENDDDEEEMDDDSEESEKEEEPKKPITFKCPQCYRLTPTIAFLKSHFYRVHADLRLSSFDIENLLKKCEKCGESYGDEDALKRHDCAAVTERFICKKCNKKFMTQSGLKMHKRMHNKGGNFKCGVCANTFKTRKAKERHEQYHKSCKKEHDKQKETFLD